MEQWQRVGEVHPSDAETVLAYGKGRGDLRKVYSVQKTVLFIDGEWRGWDEPFPMTHWRHLPDDPEE